MAPKSRIAELAALIQEKTTVLDEYYAAHNLPSPSFDESYPAVVQLPKDIEAARDVVTEANDELSALLKGPVSSIYYDIARTSMFCSVGAIAKFNLANSFPPNTTTTFAQMAAFSNLPVSAVQRLVRHAIAYHVFAEPTKGTVAHTSMSQAIATFPHLADAIEMFRDIMWPTAPRLADAIERWPGSEEPTETAFNLAQHTELGFWAYKAAHPEKTARFAAAMAFMTKKPGREMEFLLDNVDWASSLTPPEANGSGLIVDVGGSYGFIALGLAPRLPSAKFIVQDQPNVIAGAPKDADPRVEFQVHDFLTEQPVVGADVYIFRQIFHDWTDSGCRKILSAMIPALKPGARIIINDSIMPAPGTVSPAKEAVLRHSDLMMWRMFNAKERDEDDWRAVVEGTDKRFKILRVFTPPGTYLGIVEIVWEG
ncbi:S-adenosyl-L-methionine-dependent methyltransferase [Podospora aff. communis PSN243]|uniref:S-adenosyl-L-methionine-dependent methyltransferase n=1 Tax=Podospora aff. communis PSN243 TaxID=3040156 RepID=A0AAV9GSU8_9PEZI|nr:S-adenosyl-L-methionine-dependent methyltransferase [Podospora aff. communis PSN243]